ncbi:Arm DNA-binding domain-containing protein [Burkholderia pyrrocinia]|uniref:Arm DNA-binding domain-containing protein n=1 Tax=Burkholderia pyrrocinia TaxID=60550 RepID=UPI001FB4D80B|nr:Arm DNA-binding domain-containing protein [Burkholderia pyrrocinia]UOB57022.1 Arm DNA-binding domain-containing protein [Burkholderia pyrrocinia]
MALTALQVQAAKPRTKPYGLSDGNGLFLWVTTDARKYWHFRFRFEGSRDTEPDSSSNDAANATAGAEDAAPSAGDDEDEPA